MQFSSLEFGKLKKLKNYEKLGSSYFELCIAMFWIQMWRQTHRQLKYSIISQPYVSEGACYFDICQLHQHTEWIFLNPKTLFFLSFFGNSIYIWHQIYIPFWNRKGHTKKGTVIRWVKLANAKVKKKKHRGERGSKMADE